MIAYCKPSLDDYKDYSITLNIKGLGENKKMAIG